MNRRGGLGAVVVLANRPHPITETTPRLSRLGIRRDSRADDSAPSFATDETGRVPVLWYRVRHGASALQSTWPQKARRRGFLLLGPRSTLRRGSQSRRRL